MFSRSWEHKNKCFWSFVHKTSVFTVCFGKKHQPTNLSGNVVESTRYVVDSTTFPEMLSNQSTRNGVKSRNVVESSRCCRVDKNSGNVVESTRNVVGSTGKVVESTRDVGESTKFPEMWSKCCRVDDIFNFHGKRKRVVDPTTFPEMLSNRREMLPSGRHGEWLVNRREMLSSLQHSKKSRANKWKKRAPAWQHQPDVQIETVVCSFDARSASTWKCAEKECVLGAVSASSPCEKGWISVLLQVFSLGLQVLLLSAQRIGNTYSILPAGGSCNLALLAVDRQDEIAHCVP